MARQAWEIPRSTVEVQAIRNAVRPGHFPLDWVDADVAIPVSAHLEWERDGPELVDGRARAWTRTLVLVDVRDPRWPLGSLWLPAGDVARQTEHRAAV